MSCTCEGGRLKLLLLHSCHASASAAATPVFATAVSAISTICCPAPAATAVAAHCISSTCYAPGPCSSCAVGTAFFSFHSSDRPCLEVARRSCALSSVRLGSGPSKDRSKSHTLPYEKQTHLRGHFPSYVLGACPSMPTAFSSGHAPKSWISKESGCSPPGCTI